MTSLSFNITPPVLSTIGTIDGGQPFMIGSEPTEVYQPVNAVSGTIRQVRRMSDGTVTTMPVGTAVALVSIESATVGA